MSPSESVRILEALNVLCNVPREVLQSHKTELLAAVQKLQTLIEERGDPVPRMTGDPGRVSPSLPSHDSSSVPRDINESTSSSPNGQDLSASSLINRVRSSPSIQEHELTSVPSKPIEDLIQALNKESKQIKEYLSKSEQEATGKEPSWMTEDPRIVDLQMDGSHLSPEIKFRKGLSQRSLAIEFSQWENNTYGKSQVSERAQNPSILQKRRGGHIRKYLENNKHRFNNQRAARDGIGHGIKLLVCEELLGSKAVSAILTFKYRRFRTIKVDELDDLKDAITNTKWIFELVEQKAGWFDDCQSHYDAWYHDFSSRKRRRLNFASSEYEQTNPEHSHGGTQDAEQPSHLSNIDAAGPNVQDAILPRPGHLTMDAVSGEEVDTSTIQEHDQVMREVAAGWGLSNSRDAETSNSVLPAQSSSTQTLYENNLGNTGRESDIDLWNVNWNDLDLDLWDPILYPLRPQHAITPNSSSV